MSKTVVTVNSYLDMFERYKDQYRVFKKDEDAIAFALERARKAFMYMMLSLESELEIGIMYSCEGGKQYVKLIKVEVE